MANPSYVRSLRCALTPRLSMIDMASPCIFEFCAILLRLRAKFWRADRSGSRSDVGRCSQRQTATCLVDPFKRDVHESGNVWRERPRDMPLNYNALGYAQRLPRSLSAKLHPPRCSGARGQMASSATDAETCPSWQRTQICVGRQGDPGACQHDSCRAVTRGLDDRSVVHGNWSLLRA
jgi:hypothetical protein